MSFDYINEAFKRLSVLDEEVFDSSIKGINNLAEFVKEDDSAEQTVKVIDPDAADTDELADSYVGKVITNCNVCHSHIFNNKEDIEIDENGVVNAEVDCPYCGESEGFVIVGEIAPYEDTVEDTSEATPETVGASVENTPEVQSDDSDENLNEALPAIVGAMATAAAAGAGSRLVDKVFGEDVSEETCEENCSRATKRAMSEDFKEVAITTDDQHMEMTSDENGKVTVTTEPVAATSAEEVIAPVSDETTNDILANNDVETSGEEPVEDDEIVDAEFDEADAEGLDELGESYLKNVYNNVESFKTTSVMSNDRKFIVEGVIRFNSGVKKKTGFVFEAKDMNDRGQLRFVGTNTQLTESKDAFSLIGRIDNKKLFVESLKYNYTVADNSVRGLVRRK